MGAKTTASAKKRKQRERARRFRSKQVNIGEELDRWTAIKTTVGSPDDAAVAKTLIDFYLEKRSATAMGVMSATVFASSSTPVQSRVQPPSDPGLSSVTEESSDQQTSDVKLHLEKKKEIQSKVEGKKSARVEITMSSTDLEDFYDVDYDPDDPTYQPLDFDISIVQSEDETADEEYGIIDDVFDIERGEDEDETAEEVPTGEGLRRLGVVNETDMTELKYIICIDSLQDLLKMVPIKRCHRCQKEVVYQLKTTGCTVSASWVCSEGHEVYRWASSPMLPNGVYSTNFQACAAVLLSGNNFRKVSLFTQFLSLAFPSVSTFDRIQNKCVIPVVDRYWLNLKTSIVEEHRSTEIVVSGDGRMDSPGHSAKYCTYTVMNQADKKILAMEIVDKRETDLKSSSMEAKGFFRAMTALQNEGVTVKEVVTDAHPQISAIMKRSYPNVRHSYDMWHGAKNIGKKLCGIAATKGNEKLKPWVKDITNHFFHSAEKSGGDVMTMKTKWVSVLKHVTNTHSWALGQCDHGPLDDDRDPDKEWLKPSSNAVQDLQRAVFEPRLLRTFPYYVTCQTTSELESFNNHVLMYAPKRCAFSYAVYRCRCYLAAIDYTKHMERQQETDKDGNLRWRRMYSKAANNWTVVPVKGKKKYEYIPDMLTQIALEYCTQRRERPLRGKLEMEETDPRRIAKTIARKSPPPTSEIQITKKPRIKKQQ